ncbi:MAG: hypothetical protein FJ285_01045 [Planctomycetes bacterium]|nr:hypothetical protein [Planctomycetota bacterium]
MRSFLSILTALVLSVGVAGWTAAHVHLSHGQNHGDEGACRSEHADPSCDSHSCCDDHDEPTEEPTSTDHDSGCLECSLLAVVVMLSTTVPPVDQISLVVSAELENRPFSIALPSPRGIWARPPPAFN